MYSAAMSSPREGVSRPSSRSEAMNERWPRIESALMESSAARHAAGTAAACASGVREASAGADAFRGVDEKADAERAFVFCAASFGGVCVAVCARHAHRSEEHTSELQSRF